MLAINTAFMTANLALYSDGKLFVRDIDAKSKHSENVLKTIDELCQEANIDILDVQTLSVVLGPGSFTGLRIGTAIAKGLGCANKKMKFIGVSSLELMAYHVVKNNLNENENFACAINALSDLYFVQLFGQNSTKTSDARMIRKEELEGLKMPIFALKGDILKYELNEIEILSQDLVEISLKKAQAGEFLSLEQMIPVYLRASQAEDNLKKIEKVNKIS